MHNLLTLGAKLTILLHPLILKSALTTPPIRVPNISRLLFSSTAALSSNLTKNKRQKQMSLFLIMILIEIDMVSSGEA